MEKNLIDLIDSGDTIIISTKGYSMWPMLKPFNNLVKLKVIEGDIKKYDVVLFKHGSYLKLHRIVKCENDKYTISGDNTFNDETDIDRSQIIAVLESFVHDTSKIKNNQLKWISVDNRLYRLYSYLVVLFSPIRKTILKICYPFMKQRKEYYVGKERDI